MFGKEPPVPQEDRTGAQSIETGEVSIPAAGSLKRYQRIRRHPTSALAEAIFTAPIKAAQPSYKLADEADDTQLQLVRDVIDPLWSGLVRNMCTGIAYGCKPFEKVWLRRDDGKLVYKKVKPLSLEKTEIRLQEDGTFAGAKNEDVTLEEQYVFWYTHGMEDDDYFGRPMLANIEDAWESWVDTVKRQRQYTKLVACPTLMLQYPRGKGRDATGVEKSNYELAKGLVDKVSQGLPVVMPNEMLAIAKEMIERGLDPAKFAAWVWSFVEAKGQHGQDFVSLLTHDEALIFRGWLVPERTAMEGKHGTKAEASEHAAIALSCSQEALTEIVRHINWYLIDPLLAYNYGGEARGAVQAETQPLQDDELNILRRVMEKLLAENAPLFTKWVDVDAAMDQLGLPKVEEIIDESKDEGGKETGEEEDQPGLAVDIGAQLARIYGVQ